mgnify:CR=1 FL=1
MDAVNLGADTAPSSTISGSKEKAPHVVFQPQKLKEVVEIIDLMGNISQRVREDSSGDMGGGGGGTQQGGTQGASGTTTRDEAIAKAPPIPVMQTKLVRQLEAEVRQLEKTSQRLRWSNAPGNAYMLTEIFKKIRKLRTLIVSIISASADVIKRLYITAFIDRQPLSLSADGSLTNEG